MSGCLTWTLEHCRAVLVQTGRAARQPPHSGCMSLEEPSTHPATRHCLVSLSVFLFVRGKQFNAQGYRCCLATVYGLSVHLCLWDRASSL